MNLKMAQLPMAAVMVEQRSFRPFKSSEEYLYAMKEDLAEWLNSLYPDLYINVNNFMDRLDTGVALCKHANNVREFADDYVSRRQAAGKTNVHSIATSVLNLPAVRFLPGAKPGTFFARDNVSNFIAWCRHGLRVFECLLFETDDLIMRKNEKHVILCLLEVARRAAKFGMPAPMLVHLEREIDREIAADRRRLRFSGCCQDHYENDSSEEESDLTDSEDCVEYGPLPQIVTNDLKSLDEMVRDEVAKCQCPTQFPMIRVSEGKYRIGDTKVLIFVRVLRSHVMVRVGGGWDTLSHYLDKHDPCRCRTAHRTAVSSKLVGIKSGGQALELTHAQVHYERSPPRTRRSSTSSNSSGAGGTSCALASLSLTSPSKSNRSKSPQTLSPANSLDRRSRSPTPRKKMLPSQDSSSFVNRSRSPTPSSYYMNNNNSNNNNRSRSGTPPANRKQKTTLSSLAMEKKEKAANNNNNNLLTPYSYASLSPNLSRKFYPSANSNNRSRSPSANSRRSRSNTPIPSQKSTSTTKLDHAGIHPRDTSKLSSELPPDHLPPAAAVKKQEDDNNRKGGVDYSPTHKVSDNFQGTSQYHLLNTNSIKDATTNRESSPPIVVRSSSLSSRDDYCIGGIDTTPACKVSENFTTAELASPTMMIVRKGVSVNDLDAIIKKDTNDSGSEVSDEGYRSLGLVSTPPGNTHVSPVPPLTSAANNNNAGGSPTLQGRPPRSRSASGQETPSPQLSPFRRNAKTNQSARQSPTHQPSSHAFVVVGSRAGGQKTQQQQQHQTTRPVTTHSPRNYNTWNSGGTAKQTMMSKKKRSPITEDTFCQQVAEIMQQYAALMPSPRKDTRPDARISTRIPAPVQQRT